MTVFSRLGVKALRAISSRRSAAFSCSFSCSSGISAVHTLHHFISPSHSCSYHYVCRVFLPLLLPSSLRSSPYHFIHTLFFCCHRLDSHESLSVRPVTDPFTHQLDQLASGAKRQKWTNLICINRTEFFYKIIKSSIL